jgi:hypothetical protein
MDGRPPTGHVQARGVHPQHQSSQPISPIRSGSRPRPLMHTRALHSCVYTLGFLGSTDLTTNAQHPRRSKGIGSGCPHSIEWGFTPRYNRGYHYRGNRRACTPPRSSALLSPQAKKVKSWRRYTTPNARHSLFFSHSISERAPASSLRPISTIIVERDAIPWGSHRHEQWWSSVHTQESRGDAESRRVFLH